MTAEFGWSRSDIAGAVTVGTILGGLLAVGVGRLVDRFGARWALTAAFLLTGGLMILLGGIDRLWQFYAVTIVTRLLLQGVVNLVNQTILAKWFVRRRGRVMALGNLGQRFGTGTVPYIAQAIIIARGWRAAAVGLGLLTWGLTVAPVAIWLRRQPQDMGLLPDGAPPEPGTDESVAGRWTGGRATEVAYTLAEALRTRTFYILLGVVSLSSFVNTGVNFNLIPYLSDRGLSDTEAVTVLMAWSFIGIPSALVAGLLAERLSNRFLMVGLYVGLTLGIVALIAVRGLWSGMAFGLWHGAFFAGSLLMQNLILANYYGAASLATLRGFVQPWQMVANAFGPLAATLVYDATGSYSTILVAYVGLQSVVWLSLLMASPPRKRA
jgi:sugar phosphate permease